MNGPSRSFTRRAALGVLVVAFGASGVGAQDAKLTVWKDPNCGCCDGWVEHLRRNGFAVSVISSADMDAIKAEKGVPAELQSCHTATIGDYTIEGHVPAHAVQRLLAEKPAARGIAVPGMPIGSPGMEGSDPETYKVMLFGGSGEARAFGTYRTDRPV